MANKNSIKVYEFYKTRILTKISDLKEKKVLLLCIGNTKLIKEIISIAKEVIIIDEFWFSNTLFGCKYFKFINNIDYLYKLFENLGMTFDVALLNPPFSGDLHIKILDAVSNYTKLTVCTHPGDKFQKAIIVNNNLPIKITDCEIIEQETYNKIFGITNWVDGCITIIDENNKTNDYTKFTNLVKHYNIIRKIIEKTKINLSKKIKKQYTTEFPLACYVGCHWDASHNYKGTSANYSIACSTEHSGHIGYISESSDKARKNLFKSLFTTFIKFCIKAGYGNKIVPYMHSYQYEWSNKRYCDYFNITGYISDTEAEPNSDWEIILSEITK